MKHLLALLCCLLPVFAQESLQPAPNDLTADDVMKAFIEATGGPDAYAEQESMIMKMTMLMKAQNLQAKVTVYAKEPNKLMVHQNVAGMMEIKQGYDGEIGWEASPLSGVRELQGQELHDLKLTATFNYQAKWQDLFPKRELLGIQKITGKPAYVVRLTPEKASPMTYFIDTESSLLVRSDSTQISAMGQLELQSYFSDYKKVDGVQTPMTITQQTPMGEVVMKVDDIQTDVTVDDALFTKPSAPPMPPGGGQAQ